MSEAWELLQYPARTEPVGTTADWVEPVWFPQWQQPIDQPVLDPEYRHTLPSLFFAGDPSGFTVPATVPDFGWFRPADEPTLPAEYRYLIPSVFAPPLEELVSTDSGVFFEAWVQPTQQPVLPVEYRYTIPYLFVQIEPDDFSTGAAAPVAGPGDAEVQSAYVRNQAVLSPSANVADIIRSKNSVVIR